jgi:hypothetical protein
MKKTYLIILWIMVFMTTNVNATCNIQKYSFGVILMTLLNTLIFNFQWGAG